MFNREELIVLIKRGIIHQKDSISSTYINLEGEEALCPFCEGKMQVTKFENNWKMYCECDKSQEIFSKLSHLFKQKEDIDSEIMTIQKDINELALTKFKQHFIESLYKSIIQDYEDCKKEIETITTLEV